MWAARVDGGDVGVYGGLQYKIQVACLLYAADSTDCKYSTCTYVHFEHSTTSGYMYRTWPGALYLQCWYVWMNSTVGTVRTVDAKLVHARAPHCGGAEALTAVVGVSLTAAAARYIRYGTVQSIGICVRCGFKEQIQEHRSPHKNPCLDFNLDVGSVGGISSWFLDGLFNVDGFFIELMIIQRSRYICTVPSCTAAGKVK